MLRRLCLVTGLAGLCVLASSAGAADGDFDAEFDGVNRLRAQAGLPVLARDAALDAAARDHAAYLDRHREPGRKAHGVSAHQQLPDHAGFSGAMPADRALAAGYAHRDVLENVSMGYDDAASALEGLMSAIYHRLTFLDFESDRLGVAVGRRSRVFLLGRDDMTGLCADPPHEALSRQPVDCLGQPMTRDHYEAVCADLPDAALFRPSHPVSCPNGVRLDAGYMDRVCTDPPAAARFVGHGRYFEPCENGTRVNAAWFHRLCEEPPAAAVYAASGHYYEICDGPQRVHAEWFEALCRELPEAARFSDSGVYRKPCAADHAIRVEYLAALDERRRDSLPQVVLWPPDGARGIPPAFHLEEPDPLPDIAVSGYPLSIQFNPTRMRDVELQRFTLERVDGGRRSPVSEVRLLDGDSDPHGLLGSHEFALFPLRRLDWGTRYAVRVEALVDGEARHFAWQFVTAGEDLPVLRAGRPRQQFVVHAGREFLLYLPPGDGDAFTVRNTRTEHRRGNGVVIRLVDPNTLRVRVEATRCDRVRMHFDDGRQVDLTLAGCPG